jgi:hypothetical protein
MDPEEEATLLANVLRPERVRTGLEERVQAIEDKERIRELLAEYAFLCDMRRHDELYERYTEDVERRLGGTLTEVVKGKAALRERHANPVLQRKANMPGPERANGASSIADRNPRHLLSSTIVRLSDDGSQAWASAYYSLAVTRTKDGEFARGIHDGSYLFSLRKVGADWKVEKFTVFTEHAFNPLFAEVAGQ